MSMHDAIKPEHLFDIHETILRLAAVEKSVCALLGLQCTYYDGWSIGAEVPPYWKHLVRNGSVQNKPSEYDTIFDVPILARFVVSQVGGADSRAKERALYKVIAAMSMTLQHNRYLLSVEYPVQQKWLEMAYMDQMPGYSEHDEGTPGNAFVCADFLVNVRYRTIGMHK